VGVHFGLTPKKYQSGETDVTGRISKIGDAGVRTALYEAANVILTRPVKGSSLKSWGMRLARRTGMRKAKVALARKLAVVLHRMLARLSQLAADNGANGGFCGILCHRVGTTVQGVILLSEGRVSLLKMWQALPLRLVRHLQHNSGRHDLKIGPAWPRGAEGRNLVEIFEPLRQQACGRCTESGAVLAAS